MKLKTKSVGYAYPTSVIAENHDKPDGCYYVSLSMKDYADIIHSVHDTEREAFKAAMKLEEYEWCNLYVYCLFSDRLFYMRQAKVI